MPETACALSAGGSRKTMIKKVLVIIPAFNEEASIEKTIGEVRASYPGADIVVVDDGSTDRTAQGALKSGVHLLPLPFNLGIGGAVQTGFKFAAAHGYDIAVQVDGDGQHDAAFISRLVQPVIDGHADMAIGSRFLPPHLGYQSSFVRRVGIQFFSLLLSFLTEYRITDPTSGFRAYNRKMIKIFSGYYPVDFPEPEAIMVAGRYNAKIREVAVEMRKRASGHSSIRYLKTLYYMIKVTLAILLQKLHRKIKDEVRA